MKLCEPGSADRRSRLAIVTVDRYPAVVERILPDTFKVVVRTVLRGARMRALRAGRALLARFYDPMVGFFLAPSATFTVPQKHGR